MKINDYNSRIKIDDEHINSLIVKNKFDFGLQNSETNNIFILDGKKMLNKTKALEEIYHKLGFDSYIKYANYDGLIDLLQPSVWEQKNITIGITNADAFLKSDTKMVEDILDVLRIIRAGWNDFHNTDEAFTLELVSGKS